MIERLRGSNSNQQPGQGSGYAQTTMERAPRISDAELYKVDRDTDTVAGQLENYTDYGSPLMKRVAMQGQKDAARRGLTNSTIAVGAARGAVLDRAGDFAKADAGIYNDRKTESLRSVTAIEGSNIGADAQRYSADKSADASIRSSQIAANSASNVARIDNDAAAKRQAADITSRERVALFDLAEDSNSKRADREMRETIARMDSDTRLQMAEMETQFNNSSLDRRLRSDIFTDMANGINSIDQTAAPATQSEQARRIMEFGSIRLRSSGFMDAALSAL